MNAAGDNDRVSGLPIIPHCEIEPECCGCLCEVAADTTYFVCNECGAVVSKEEATRIVIEMESTRSQLPVLRPYEQN
jgi:hypothetical protein